jgi:hypothetical protein
MDALPTAFILSARVINQEARSALPDSPVVPHVARAPVAPHVRKAVAAALRRLAEVVAPPLPADRGASRLRLSAAANRSGAAQWDESPCRPSPTR